eukprot:m.103508 g.103508  ORF g.103508 m.103508 type:complete len:409 (+) comp10479_c0_seq1:358-1584(+)
MQRLKAFASKVWDGYAWRITGVAGAYVIGNWAYGKYERSLFREEMCRRAMPVGDAPLAHPLAPPYKVQVVLNPKSGRAIVRDLWDEDIRTVLQFAAHVYDDPPLKVLMTEEPEQAKMEVQDIDLSTIDGLCVLGGDGALQEVITGLMRRPDREAVSKLPIGVIPTGTANMFASALHTGEADDTAEGKAGWAALTVALQHTRKVDVLEVTTGEGEVVYALSALGWGAPGVMAASAERQAWLRSHRYWYSAAMGLIATGDNEANVPCRARIAYPKGAGDEFVQDERSVPDRPGWVEREVDVTALVASKVPSIAVGCGVNEDVKLDDGLVTLTWLPSRLNTTRRALYSTGFRLSKGHTLAEEEGSESIKVREFTVDVLGDNAPPINVDGEAFDPRNVHVRVLPEALTMYAL